MCSSIENAYNQQGSSVVTLRVGTAARVVVLVAKVAQPGEDMMIERLMISSINVTDF